MADLPPQQETAIRSLELHTYRVPTDQPESDGTLQWDHTTVVVVIVHTANASGLGWTYAAPAAASVVREVLEKKLIGQDALAIEGCWQTMVRAVRNDNRGGLCAMAVSAVDVALWDLKARLLNLPLVDLFGPVREAAPIYGSGGFTSYSDHRLAEQLGKWVSEGIGRVKMKIGRDPSDDPRRVREARRVIGDGVSLFVDGNGAYARKQALALAEQFRAEADVGWFEEPVSSDDLAGLHLLRDRAPAGMEIAAGEYGDTPTYFRRMLQAQAVDCLQIDATRCGGYTGFLKAAALCEAYQIPCSAHCGPQLHAHVACCVPHLQHVEYFHDHARLAPMLFDGTLSPAGGSLRPDRTRPGHGLSLKAKDAEQYAI